MNKWDLSQECKSGSIWEKQSIYLTHCNNKTKHKNHMIISKDAEKVIEKKTKYLFKIKTLKNKKWKKRPQNNKGKNENCTANIMVKNGKISL